MADEDNHSSTLQTHLFDVETAEAALPQLIISSSATTSLPCSFDTAAAEAALPPLLALKQHRQPLRLDTLGDDLLKCIFDYIPYRFHLRKYLRVNKKFHSHALPRVYNRFTITISTQTHTRYAELLVDTHSGVKHIKELYLQPKASGKVPDSAHQWIKAFLGKLEEGQLSWFRWECDWTMPLDLLKYVWTTQPNISRLQINGLKSQDGDQTLVDLIEQLDTSRMVHCKWLELTPYKVDNMLAGSKALAKFDNISGLLMDGLLWSEDEPHRTGFDGESSSSEESSDNDAELQDKLTAALFSHQRNGIPQTLKPRWDGLRSLWISDINMRYCRQTWFAHLDLVNLGYLNIRYCAHADVFLTELMRTQPPQLKDFTLIHRVEPGSSDRILVDLAEFLHMTKGRLRCLDLFLRDVPRAFDVVSINRHRATLEQLSIDIFGNPASGTYTTIQFNYMLLTQLLGGCNRLSQLAISLPPVTWEYRNGDLLSANTEFGLALAAIFTLVDLKTLNILNLFQSFGYGKSTAYYCTMAAQWERIATDIFSNIREGRTKPGRKTRRLEVLAFGSRWRIMDFPVPRYYVECEFDRLYKTRWKAQQVSLRELGRENMDVDILDKSWRDFDKGHRTNGVGWDYYVDDETYRSDYSLGPAHDGEDADEGAAEEAGGNADDGDGTGDGGEEDGGDSGVGAEDGGYAEHVGDGEDVEDADDAGDGTGAGGVVNGVGDVDVDGDDDADAEGGAEAGDGAEASGGAVLGEGADTGEGADSGDGAHATPGHNDGDGNN